MNSLNEKTLIDSSPPHHALCRGPKLRHEFSEYRGVLTFGNGPRIIAGHFQAENDIDAYLGLEYDVIGIEERVRQAQMQRSATPAPVAA